MMRSELIVDPRGQAAAKDEKWLEPKGSSPYFGWIDDRGDSNTVRIEGISAVVRDARTGRYAILMANCPISLTIADTDAYRLMRRLGWTLQEEK